jgi:hypothetical protein
MITHSLIRTSPIGEDFIGRCVLCGQENLHITAVQEICPNPRNISQEQTLLDAILGNNDADS